MASHFILNAVIGKISTLEGLCVDDGALFCIAILVFIIAIADEDLA